MGFGVLWHGEDDDSPLKLMIHEHVKYQHFKIITRLNAMIHDEHVKY